MQDHSARVLIPIRVPRSFLAAEFIGDAGYESIRDGDEIEVRDGYIYQNGRLVASGKVLGIDELKERIKEAYDNLDKELYEFAENTIDYIKKERKLLFEDIEIPKLKTDMKDRNVLVVVRGHDFEEDIRALLHFIRNEKPVVIAVDGAADHLLEYRIVPDIILGDMDSVRPETLRMSRDVVVHAYLDGRAPGLTKVLDIRGEKDVHVFKFQGTSEDAALVLAYEAGASMIVLVGSHTNIIDFLDKGRKGMASTFLTRLRVGHRLIDAKGVNRIYHSHANPFYLASFAAVLILLFIVSVMLSSPVRNLITVIALKLQIIFQYF